MSTPRLQWASGHGVGAGPNPSLAAVAEVWQLPAAQAARELSANGSRRCGSNSAIKTRAPHPTVGANGPQERAPPDQPPLNGADRISADPVRNARLFASATRPKRPRVDRPVPPTRH